MKCSAKTRNLQFVRVKIYEEKEDSTYFASPAKEPKKAEGITLTKYAPSRDRYIALSRRASQNSLKTTSIPQSPAMRDRLGKLPVLATANSSKVL